MMLLPSRFMMIFLLTIPLMGQDLNNAWQDYMTTNATLTSLESEKALYTQEQIDLKEDVLQLQKNSTWYNAWMNKYLLSNRSKRQLVILDSLRSIDTELARLQELQEDEIGRLKLAYEMVLKDYEENGVRPSEQGLRNLQVGRYNRVIQTNHIVLFPDYTDLLSIDWRNEEQRKLILGDVQGLLQLKILELDSIRTVREGEAELALRLADFHEDLGLQMASDQDAQKRDASGDTEKMLGWQFADESTSPTSNDFVEDGGRDMTAGLTQESIDLINVSVPGENVRDMSLEQRSGKDLTYLKKKLEEYETLLKEINQELNQSP